MRTVPGALSLAFAASLAAGCVGSTTGDDAAGQDAGLAGAPWLLVGMDGEEISTEPRVTLEIDSTRVGGWGGCNAYGGELALGEDGALSVGPIEQTAMACADEAGNRLEADYVRRLGAATRLEEGGDGRLTLAGPEGTLAFRRLPAFGGDPAALAGTSWRLETVDGRPPAAPFTLAFADTAVAFGRAGCRAHLDTWTETEDGRIAFPSKAMAGEPCEPSAGDEGAVTDPLTWTRDVVLTSSGDLEIRTLRGEVLAFAPLDIAPDLAGTRWRLLAFDAAPEQGWLDAPPPSAEVTLVFEEDSRVTGRAACNSMDGAYETDGRALTVRDLVATEMACAGAGVMKTETRFLHALAAATGFAVAGDVLRIEAAGERGLLFEAYPDY